jgi:1-acyl-sn-glycerol-3-phosphate acyltransferase
MDDPGHVAAARKTPFYRLACALVRGLALLWFRWRVYGAGNVPRVGPVILASNHVSVADPALIGSALPRAINFLGRENLFEVPVFSWVIRHLNAFPVDRDGGGGAGLKAILDRLQAGGGIILFPEGTRSPDGKLQPGKPGIGLAVIKSAAPVVPTRIFGGFEAWGRHRKWPRPRRIDIKFGVPMEFATLRAEAASCARPRLKAIYQQIADEIMAAIAKLEPCEDKTEFP